MLLALFRSNADSFSKTDLIVTSVSTLQHKESHVLAWDSAQVSLLLATPLPRL